MALVSIQKCKAYDRNLLKESIQEALDNIGFDTGVFKGARVALKPNILSPSHEDKAITTHPEFFRAGALIVKESGGTPVLMESPAVSSLTAAVRKTKYKDVVAEEKIEVAGVTKVKTLFDDNAETFKRIDISECFFDVDVVVNLPKLKTHGLTYITAATKNLFGVMPGLRKSRMHMRVPESREFSEWLLDLNGALLNGFSKPKKFVHIMDAVVGMQGEGPGPSGMPKDVGVVIASEDQIALDYVATRVAGLDYRKVNTITMGFKRPWSVSAPEEIEVRGERIEDVEVANYQPTSATISSHVLRGWVVGPSARNLFVEKPWPSVKKCTQCYKCMQICPATAIDKAKTRHAVPKYDYKKCIRCFCCMEICPEAAISLKKGKLQWILRV